MKRLTWALVLLTSTLQLGAADPSTTRTADLPLSIKSSFSRVALAGDRPADVVRLFDSEGTDSGKLVLVEDGNVTVVPDSEVASMKALDTPIGVEKNPTSVMMNIRFGDGAFSRGVMQTGRVGSFQVVQRARELKLQFVSVPGTAGDSVNFVLAWRLFESGRVKHSGHSVVSVAEGRETNVVMKSPGDDKPYAQAWLQLQ